MNDTSFLLSFIVCTHPFSQPLSAARQTLQKRQKKKASEILHFKSLLSSGFKPILLSVRIVSLYQSNGLYFIYFIDFCFSYSSKTCEQFWHICRSKKLSTRFSGIWCIHSHKVLIRTDNRICLKPLDIRLFETLDFRRPFLLPFWERGWAADGCAGTFGGCK